MTQWNFPAQSYQGRAQPLNGQRLLNMFCERQPEESKDPDPVFMCPGLSVWARMGQGPINGMHVMNNVLYVISGSALYSVNTNGAATLIGTTTLGGPVSMADNEFQLVMVDGNNGWVYQPLGLNQVLSVTALQGATSIVVFSTGTITNGQKITVTLDSGVIFRTTVSGTPTGNANGLTITLAAALPSQATAGAIATVAAVTLGKIQQAAFQPANTVVYFDNYFCFDAAGTNTWFISNNGDGTQYQSLDFASAQADPDFILALVNYHEQLLIFGGSTIEVWYDAGAANFPFQRFDGAFVQRGLIGARALAKEDNTVFWLGDDKICYRLNGYQPVRISTFPVEYQWDQYVTIADAQFFAVTVQGHKFLFINFPTAQKTWCYDISSGTDKPLWHERESWGSAWV